MNNVSKDLCENSAPLCLYGRCFGIYSRPLRKKFFPIRACRAATWRCGKKLQFNGKNYDEANEPRFRDG